MASAFRPSSAKAALIEPQLVNLSLRLFWNAVCMIRVLESSLWTGRAMVVPLTQSRQGQRTEKKDFSVRQRICSASIGGGAFNL